MLLVAVDLEPEHEEAEQLIFQLLIVFIWRCKLRRLKQLWRQLFIL